MTSSVLVMARAPVAGEAKTRLEPLLGAERCARLQSELIRQAAGLAAEVSPGGAFVAHTGQPADVASLVPAECELFGQEGRDLGERLARATARVFERRPGPLLVIGTDAPALAPAHLTVAAEELKSSHACFGPAADGGYWLVGLDRACPALFALPTGEWGGPRVLELSLAAARDAGVSVSLLTEQRDLDTPDDARALLREAALPAPVAALVEPALAAE